MGDKENINQVFGNLNKHLKILAESFKNIIGIIEKSFGPLANQYVHKRVSYKSKYWKILLKNLNHTSMTPNLGSNEKAKYLMER